MNMNKKIAIIIILIFLWGKYLSKFLTLISLISAGFTINGMFRNFKISCRLGEDDANIIGSIMFFQLTF